MNEFPKKNVKMLFLLFNLKRLLKRLSNFHSNQHQNKLKTRQTSVPGAEAEHCRLYKDTKGNFI